MTEKTAPFRGYWVISIGELTRRIEEAKRLMREERDVKRLQGHECLVINFKDDYEGNPDETGENEYQLSLARSRNFKL
jgi:hypothetical protein